ncbi:MAG: arsenite methyltransferase [Chlamydiales bacterium]|jgi:arsenite methyltransferase
MPEQSNADIHAEVSRSYERALGRSLTPTNPGESASAPGCCGTVSAETQPHGSAAKLVDYSSDAADVPEQALGSSFGCGNPLAFSDVLAGQTVVDLGSGAGLDLLIASKKVGPQGQVIGIDMTDAMIEEARRNIERAGVSNVDVRKGVIEQLPLEDASADWVISNCVINLSPDKDAVFGELARTLKPGGRISISDIVVEQLPEELRQHAAVRAACIGGAISEDQYVAGLEAAGLVDVTVVERLVYDEDQLLSIVSLDAEGDACDASTALSSEQIRAAARGVVGKVWSAKFQASMPA